MRPTRIATALLIGSVSTGLAAPALADDVLYEIVNGTDLTVMEFYTSPVDVGSWNDDVLGADILGPGEAGTVTIADGSDQCDRDLRFVFDDGQEMIDTVDVCETASYTLSPAR